MDTGSSGDDRALIARILAGSIPDWHFFVARYSPLVLSVIRRTVFRIDEDDLRNIYVDVLEHLYRGSLVTFEGRSSLASWLVLVTRNHAKDHLRRRFGRRERPRGADRLEALDAEIFQLFYVQGLSSYEVLARFGAAGRSLRFDAFLEALGRIETTLDRRSMRRYEYDLRARGVGVAGGRLLEYLDETMAAAAGYGSEQPDAGLLEAEAARTAQLIRGILARLPTREREVLALRFEEQLPAEAIASRMGLACRRRAYTLIDRAIRSVRRMLDEVHGTAAE